VTTSSGPLGATFIGPLCLLFGFLGLLGLTVTMLMRSAMIYLVAALAPLVWSSSVLPIMRDSSRRLVHLLVALVVSKLAIVISLVVAVQLAANVSGDPDTARPDLDAAAAVGTLVTGFACFLVAAISPMVLYRLMPTVEGAVASAGIVSGWGRAAMSVGQAALMTKGLGAAAAATRAVAGQQGVAGSTGGAGGPAVTGLAAATRAATATAQSAGGAAAKAGEQAGGGDNAERDAARQRHPSASAQSAPVPKSRHSAGDAGESGAPSELPPLPQHPSRGPTSPASGPAGRGAGGSDPSGPAGSPPGGQS